MRWNTPKAALLLLTLLFGAVAGAIAMVSPPEVEIGPVLLELLGLIAGVGVPCLVLMGMAVPKNDPDRWPNAIRSTTVVVAILTVGAGIRAGLDVGEAAQVSDDILVDRPDIGRGAALLRPNLRGATVVAPDRPHNPQDLTAGDRFDRVRRTRVFKVDTNSAGFRGPEFSSKPSSLRIVAVGDSFTFGWGVSHAEAWPSQLQAITDIETINAGVPAANLDVLMKVIESQGSGWNADIILLAEWPLLLNKDPVGQFAHLALRARTAVAPAKLGIILPPVSTFDPLSTDIGPSVVQSLKRALGDIPLLDLNVAIQAAGGEGVVLRRQGKMQSLVRVPSGEVLVQAEGTAHQIADPIIRAIDNDRTLNEPLFFDGGHTSAQGNAVVARSISTWLQELGWVQVDP